MKGDIWIMKVSNEYYIHRLDLGEEDRMFTVMSKKEVETDTQIMGSYAALKTFDDLVEAEEYVQTREHASDHLCDQQLASLCD